MEKSYTAIGGLEFYGITEAINGGYIGVGYISENYLDTGNAYLLKIDNNGNEVWSNKFRLKNATSAHTIQKINGGYLVGENTSIYTKEQPFFVRTNLNGDTLYSKALNFSQKAFFTDLKIINSNKYVLCANEDTLVGVYWDGKAKIVLIDSMGQVLHEKEFFYGWGELLESVLPLSNGDIISSGLTESFGYYHYYSDIFLIRMDSSLNVPPIGINSENRKIPMENQLLQNYPNPFNSTTVIRFNVNHSFTHVKLIIYDNLGRQVDILVNKTVTAGSYSVVWDATNNASGVYFYKLITGDFINTKKMILIK